MAAWFTLEGWLKSQRVYYLQNYRVVCISYISLVLFLQHHKKNHDSIAIKPVYNNIWLDNHLIKYWIEYVLSIYFGKPEVEVNLVSL